MFNVKALRDKRLKNLYEIMEKMDLDALILTILENVRYATDIRPIHSIFHINNYFSVIIPDEKPILLSSEADRDFVKHRLPWVRWSPLPSFVPSGTVLSTLAERVTALLPDMVRRIGYDSLSFELWKGISEAIGADLISVQNEILKKRAVKCEEEIDVMERATQLAEIGMEAVRENLKPGITESELAAEAIHAMKKAGAEAESHMPAIRSGENAAILQRVDSCRRIVPGDSVIVDLGARYLGYSAEYCRTMVVGRPSPRLKEMYRVLFKAYSAGLEIIRPGTKVCEIDRAIRKVIEDAGYPDYPHATGHGIGMANAEYPTIDRASEVPLEEGMIICVEPGIYVPGIGGVKEEDIILVTETGYRTLSKTPYEERLIR